MGLWLDRLKTGYYDQPETGAVLDGAEVSQTESKQLDNVITLATLSDLDGYGIMQADKCYFNRLMMYKPSKVRSELTKQYCKTWIDEYSATECDYKKANQARRKANTWIMEQLCNE